MIDGQVHIHAPQPYQRNIKAGRCPDCKKRTRFLAFFTEWYGSDATCIRCGRHWADGEWIALDFHRWARQENIDNVEVLRLRQQVTAQEVTLAAHGDLAKRHSVTEAAEIRRDVRELMQDLAAEKRITAHALTLLDKLVRNTEYRQSVQSTVPLVMPGTNGCMPTTTTMCGSDTKTSEAA